MSGRLVPFQNPSLSIGALVFRRRTTASKDLSGMTERSRRESLLLGVIVGAVIAMGIIIPIIALSV